MDKLNELIANEYDAMAAMEIPASDRFERAMALIAAKLTNSEFVKVESAIYEECVNSEHKAFEQGFLRCIVVMKGGALT